MKALYRVMKGKYYNRSWNIQEMFAESLEQLFMENIMNANEEVAIKYKEPENNLAYQEEDGVREYISQHKSILDYKAEFPLRKVA